MCAVVYICTYVQVGSTVLYIACEGVEVVRHVCCKLEGFLHYFEHVLWSVQVNFQFCIICTDEAHDGPNVAQLNNNC